MKILKSKKLVRKCAITFAGTLLLTTAVQATSLTKKIDATFRNIQVYYNSQAKTMAQEPFVYNGSVYLPVRAVSELVDKKVEWVPATNSVLVSDKGGVSSSDAAAQLSAQTFEIARLKGEKELLEKKVTELEAKVKEQGSGVVSDASLQKTLRYITEAFDYKHSIDWDFKLSEANSRLNVEVSFDSRYDDRKWETLTTAQRELFFRDIAREIRLDFKDALINGSVVDSRTSKALGTFSYSKTNAFTYTDNSSNSFTQLQKDLKNLYKTIDTTGLSINDIELKGTDDNITFTLYIDLLKRTDRDKWSDAMDYSPDKIRDLMDDIREDILYDYRYATVQGFVEDLSSGNTLAKYDGRRLY